MRHVNDRAGTITILIAVAVRLYRDGLAAALGAHPHLQVCGTADTSLQALSAVREMQPDVVVVDVSLEDVVGLIGALRAASSTSRLLTIAVKEDITTILQYAGAGADGFVTAGSSVVELIEAIERIVDGELLCSARIAAQLLKRASEQSGRPLQRSVALPLTDREMQVFSLLKLGRSNKQIALALNIAEATVKNHVHHVLEKLQVSTRGQAIAAATSLQWPVASRAVTFEHL